MPVRVMVGVLMTVVSFRAPTRGEEREGTGGGSAARPRARRGRRGVPERERGDAGRRLVGPPERAPASPRAGRSAKELSGGVHGQTMIGAPAGRAVRGVKVETGGYRGREPPPFPRASSRAAPHLHTIRRTRGAPGRASRG